MADDIPRAERTGPPMFPQTADLATRRHADDATPDREAWLRDIRAEFDDDPLNTP